MTTQQLQDLIVWAIELKRDESDQFAEVYLNNVIMTASKKLEELVNDPF